MKESNINAVSHIDNKFFKWGKVSSEISVFDKFFKVSTQILKILLSEEVSNIFRLFLSVSSITSLTPYSFNKAKIILLPSSC